MIKINLKNVLFITILVALVSCVSVYATSTYLFDSVEVKYDNTTSNLQSSNVQGAIDELYVCANNYVSYNDRLVAIETLTNGNAGFHNSVFRGKDVTSYYTDGTLYTRISSGEFTDLYVGDYIVKNGVNWRIAGFDIYYGKGDTAFNKHHAVIVPDTNLTSAQMNESNSTTLKLNTSEVDAQGYVGSKMYNETLPSVLTTYITPVFGDHVLEYRNLLANRVDTTRYNRYGTASGATSSWAWYTRKLDLMNENQVTGSIEWSSSGYETGSDNIQFPLFRLKPEFVNKQRSWYWLRNVTSASYFAFVSSLGFSDFYYASASGGVRPFFYID